MTSKELIEAYASGRRNFGNAYLRGAYLRGANLSSANLGGADLRGAYLSSAYLRGADLSSAYLSSANLGSADLRGANLGSADLSSANLGSADLGGAALSSANLGSADLRGANNFPAREIAKRQIVPVAGDLHVWKKLSGGVICQLIVPDGTPRVGGLIGRKCRAQSALVVSGEGVSSHDFKTQYHPGNLVVADGWDPDPLVECSGGIHFFLTREEAEDYCP